MRREAAGQVLARDAEGRGETGHVDPTTPGHDPLDRRKQILRHGRDA